MICLAPSLCLSLHLEQPYFKASCNKAERIIKLPSYKKTKLPKKVFEQDKLIVNLNDIERP